MPPQELLLWVFCLVDDALAALKLPKLRGRGSAPTLTDAEVITIELVGEFWGLDADKAIYRHFGTRCRAELLARWIRRGRGARFAWADAPDAPHGATAAGRPLEQRTTLYGRTSTVGRRLRENFSVDAESTRSHLSRRFAFVVFSYRNAGRVVIMTGARSMSRVDVTGLIEIRNLQHIR